MRSRRARLTLGAVTIVTATLAASTLALAGGKHHGEHSLTAKLVGFQEVPSINTAGHAKLELALADDKLTFHLDYADLTGPPAAAHIHVGQRGVNGGVSVFFCGGGGKPACPAAASGSISGTIVATDVVGPTKQGYNVGDLAPVLTAIRHGLTYANMHTTRFPDGEIRAQLADRKHDGHDGHDGHDKND